MATKQQIFIAAVAPGAIVEWKKYGILPSLSIAQAILESAWGTSGLTQRGQALFGIKAGANWTGKRLNCKTFEIVSGNRVDMNADFRAYANWMESMDDHGALLGTASRYANIPHNRDYRAACRNVQADGYATDPSYADKLIGLIEQYGLTQYDQQAFALTDAPAQEAAAASQPAPTPAPAPAPAPQAPTPGIGKDQRVKVKPGAKTYTGGGLASFVYKNVYTVLEQPKGDRVVIGINGAVTAAVHAADLIVQ